jgi:hypothetical protein
MHIVQWKEIERQIVTCPWMHGKLKHTMYFHSAFTLA